MPYAVRPTDDGRWEVYRTDTGEHVSYSVTERDARTTARIRQQKHDEKVKREKEERGET